MEDCREILDDLAKLSDRKHETGKTPNLVSRLVPYKKLLFHNITETFQEYCHVLFLLQTV